MKTPPAHLQNKRVLLSAAYLPPLQYMSKALINGEIWIEDDENYIKQTYRNRCIIAGPNGKEILTVPVERGSFHKVHIRDVRIDYDVPWQRLHLRALHTAYRSSPFYEYYIEELETIFRKKTRYLLDLDVMLLESLLQTIGIECRIRFTEKYVHEENETSYLDYRERIHPKKNREDPLFRHPVYHQVFDDRHGFLEGLSIIDLLFNEGPDTAQILEKGIVFRTGT